MKLNTKHKTYVEEEEEMEKPIKEQYQEKAQEVLERRPKEVREKISKILMEDIEHRKLHNKKAGAALIHSPQKSGLIGIPSKDTPDEYPAGLKSGTHSLQAEVKVNSRSVHTEDTPDAVTETLENRNQPSGFRSQQTKHKRKTLALGWEDGTSDKIIELADKADKQSDVYHNEVVKRFKESSGNARCTKCEHPKHSGHCLLGDNCDCPLRTPKTTDKTDNVNNHSQQVKISEKSFLSQPADNIEKRLKELLSLGITCSNKAQKFLENWFKELADTSGNQNCTKSMMEGMSEEELAEAYNEEKYYEEEEKTPKTFINKTKHIEGSNKGEE